MKKTLICSILSIFAFGLFAAPNFLEKKDFDHSSIKNLDFDLSWENLEVKETFDTNITIEVYCNDKRYAPAIKASDSTISINSKQNNFNFFSWGTGTRCTLVVYIPQGKNFKDIDIQSSSGEQKYETELRAKYIDLSASSGDIKSEKGLFADEIKIRVSSGEIYAKNLDADTLYVEASSGDIEINQYTGGTGSIKASSGEIEVDGFAVEYAKFETSSGEITVKNLDCDYFDFSSTSGEQYASLKNAPIAKSKMQASSGDITLIVPKNADFQVDVHSSSGTFKDGFSNNKFVPRETYHERINAGGPLIEINTSSGSIELDY